MKHYGLSLAAIVVVSVVVFHLGEASPRPEEVDGRLKYFSNDPENKKKKADCKDKCKGQDVKSACWWNEDNQRVETINNECYGACLGMPIIPGRDRKECEDIKAGKVPPPEPDAAPPPA